MNRTTVFLAFAGIIFVGMIGVILIVLLRPDATATMIGAITTLAAILSAFAVTAYGLGRLNETVQKQSREVTEVKNQTNGRLTRYANRNTQLVRLLMENGIEIPKEAHYDEHT